jgi:lysophospholipase L1-like esterase
LSPPRRRPWLIRAGLLILSLLLVLLSCELAIRIYQYARYQIPIIGNTLNQSAAEKLHPIARLPNILDQRLGWRGTPNYRYQGQELNPDGSTYALVVSKNSMGFRAFGAVSTSKPKIFVLGDSFTEALQVSDNEPYYAIVGKVLNCEIFAAGSNGYGSLQEYMLLDQFIDQIHPDLILWQFCYNDFMDNSYNLGLQWKAGSLSLERPFWQNGKIVYRVPRPFPWLYIVANRWSRFLPLLTTRLDRLLAPPPGEDLLLKAILQQGDKHPGFAEAVIITDQIMNKVADRAGPTPVVVFESGTTASPFYPAVQKIATRHGMFFVKNLPGVLDLEEQKGRRLYSRDKIHWNQEGHRLVAETLCQFLNESNLLRNH